MVWFNQASVCVSETAQRAVIIVWSSTHRHKGSFDQVRARNRAQNKHSAAVQGMSTTLKIHFTKLQGLGNDYLFIEDWNEEIRNHTHLSKVMSDRHFGVGSDGIIIVMHSNTKKVCTQTCVLHHAPRTLTTHSLFVAGTLSHAYVQR